LGYRGLGNRGAKRADLANQSKTMKNLSLKIKKDNENKTHMTPYTPVNPQGNLLVGGAPVKGVPIGQRVLSGVGGSFGPPKRGGRKLRRATEITRVGAKNSKRVNMPKKQDTLTEYQSQYKAKQQIKYFYGGISETSLRRLVKTMPAGHPAICELEKRLDVVLFRLGFASTIFEARSLIKGGSIKLNDIRGSATQSRELLNKTQVQVGSKITIDTTKAG
jgi:hypothetical protein